MEMSAENRLHIQAREAFQDGLRIYRAAPNKIAQRKVRKDNGGLVAIEPGQIFVQPMQGRIGDDSVLRLRAFACVQPNDLPPAVFEVVVDLLGKNPLVGQTVAPGNVIMVANHDMNGDLEFGEGVANPGQLRRRSLIGQIASEQTELGLGRTLFHLNDDLFEPRAAGRLTKVQVVYCDEGELLIRSFRAQKTAWPKTKREQSGRAQPEHLATC